MAGPSVRHIARRTAQSAWRKSRLSSSQNEIPFAVSPSDDLVGTRCHQERWISHQPACEYSDPAQHGAVALAILGENDRAREWLARVLSIDLENNFARYNAACTYSLLGEIDRSIDLLEVCLEQFGSDMKLWFINDSDLDPIRTNSRYQALLKLAQ